MNFELLIPVTLFVCIAYSIKAVVDARVRKQLVSSNGSPDLVASILRADVAQRTLALKARGVTPGLSVILVGDNPASQVYVRNKVKACDDAGLYSVL